MSVTTPVNPTYDISILSTDFIPNSTQTDLLKENIVDQKQVLALMNTELREVQLRVRELGDNISEVERTLKVNEALLSPSRRLAPETLGQVFLYCLPGINAVVTVNPSLAPLVLTHVSRRWRRVAHGTPQLWERIYLGRGFSHQLHILIPLWLTNSGVTPLDVHASLQDWHFDCDRRLMERDLVRLLLPNIYRCRWLVSSMSTAAIEFLFGRDIVMPYLEELEIWLPVWSSLVVPKLGNIQTPRLRSISLNDTGFLTSAFHSPLPSVQHLQLTGQETFGLLSHSRCLDFIALCPNLRTLTLTLGKDPGTLLRSPFILDSLCSLHLIFQFSPHDPIPFLKGFHTPHIERLTLQNHGGVSPVPHIGRVLNMLLSVRPHTIKELNLSSLFVPTSDWVPSLCELTELTSLSITGDSLDEYFFDVLAADGPLGPRTCPNLMFLKLHHVTGLLGLSGDRLVAFIRSRAPLHRDVPIATADDQKHLIHVSLILCDLENHHKDQLRDIERECNGALHLHGLEPSSSGTSHDLFNLIHPATPNFMDDLEFL